MVKRFRLYIIPSFLLFFIITNCCSQDSITSYKIKYYSVKAINYLDREKALAPYYSINASGTSIFASPQDKLNKKVEFIIPWSLVDNFNSCLKECKMDSLINILKEKKLDSVCYISTRKENSFLSEKKLKGLKIAIDAGHTAGDMATGEIEKKCLKFKRDSIHGLPVPIEIAEGVLTYATAKLLKEKLESEGAEVLMTRAYNGCTAFGKTFDEWLIQDYDKVVDSIYKLGKITLQKKQWLLKKANDRDKFRLVFKDLELEKRAEIINNYKSDLTIIIHYNVDETNIGWEKPASKNFNMAFVGGAFSKDDLSSPEKRIEFLHLLLSDDLEKSISLSNSVVKSFEDQLCVRTASITDAKYLSNGCLKTEANGVYCRNLQLTRYVHSPLVYGETLYQDNINECNLLNKECDKTKNERIQQVAEAYFQGILNYIGK